MLLQHNFFNSRSTISQLKKTKLLFSRSEKLWLVMQLRHTNSHGKSCGEVYIPIHA